MSSSQDYEQGCVESVWENSLDENEEDFKSLDLCEKR